MADYKSLYDLCLESWKQDWELSKHFSATARTYLITLGLAFSYSLLKVDGLFILMEQGTNPEAPPSDFLPRMAGGLLVVYFAGLAVALLGTVVALLRPYPAIPALEKLKPFQEAGLNDRELQATYYEASQRLLQSIQRNAPILKLKRRCLTVASWCLTIAAVAFVAFGAVVIWLRLV